MTKDAIETRLSLTLDMLQQAVAELQNVLADFEVEASLNSESHAAPEDEPDD